MNEEIKKWREIKQGSRERSHAHNIALETLEHLEKYYCENCDKEIKKGKEFCSDKCEEEYNE